MAHTDKDQPYYLQGRKVIEHNHANGKCIVGDFHESRKIRNQHILSKECLRVNKYNILCIHDYDNEVLSNELDQLSNPQKEMVAKEKLVGYELHRLEFIPPHSSSRVEYLIHQLLKNKFLPFCQETKTHIVDTKEMDVEKLPYNLSLYNDKKTFYSYRYASRYEVLRPQYDKTVPCQICDNDPTCFVFFEKDYIRKCGCSSCRTTSKTIGSFRDESKKLIKEYNSAGSLDI